MMAEYIKREALKEHLYGGKFQEGCAGCDEPGEGCIECIVDEIDNFPAVDVATVQRGQWKPAGFTFMGKCVDCSECGYRIAASIGWDWNYCPNCGAKMEVEHDKRGSD